MKLRKGPISIKMACLCALGLTLGELAIPVRAAIQPGDNPETIARAKAAAAGIAPPATPPAPGAPAEASAPAAKPAVAPEDEPVADATTPDATAQATPEYANPYDVIIDRNIFRLNPQPPPPPPPAPPPPDVPTVKISGFSKINDKVKGFFATVPKDPKEAAAYFGLYEGERQGILELIKIHPGQEEADVIIAGVPMTLSVKSNSFVQPVAVAPKGPGIPGSAPVPMKVMPNGAAPPAAAAAPYVPGAGTSFIAGGANSDYSNRGRGGPVVVSGGASFTPSAGAAGGTGQVNVGDNRSIPMPLRGIRSSTLPPAYPPENHQGSVEQQALNMIVNGHAVVVEPGQTAPTTSPHGGPPPLPFVMPK